MGDRDMDGAGGAKGSGEGNASVPGGAEGDNLGEALSSRDPTPDADDPVAAGAGQADAGSPGGMGGVSGGMPNPDHRPNGGVSPIRSSGDNDRH